MTKAWQCSASAETAPGLTWSDAGEPTPRTALGAASRTASQPRPARAGGLVSRLPQAHGCPHAWLGPEPQGPWSPSCFWLPCPQQTRAYSDRGRMHVCRTLRFQQRASAASPGLSRGTRVLPHLPPGSPRTPRHTGAAPRPAHPPGSGPVASPSSLSLPQCPSCG